MKRQPGTPLKLYVLSGGSGHTCNEVIRAALAQFPGVGAELVQRPRVDSVEVAVRVAEEAASQAGVVCHSLVQPEVRQGFLRAVEKHDLPTVDVLGPLISVLEDSLGVSPVGRPGLSYALHKEQFDRMDAVDFTLAHDDGQRSAELDQADIVIVGVSRVSKSVTCFYLAYRGIRAANVPLSESAPPPAALLSLPPGKVVGLTMNPHRLRLLREMRLERLGSPPGDYTLEPAIRAELRYAQRLMTEQGWVSIDVSYKAVEEVAGELLHRIR